MWRAGIEPPVGADPSSFTAAVIHNPLPVGTDVCAFWYSDGERACVGRLRRFVVLAIHGGRTGPAARGSYEVVTK